MINDVSVRSLSSSITDCFSCCILFVLFHGDKVDLSKINIYFKMISFLYSL